MKRALAIILSVALIALAQPFASGGDAKSACNCDCSVSSCCANRAPAAPTETPTAPAPNTIQKDLQTIIWLTAKAVDSYAVPPTRIESSVRTAPSSSVVSLFIRDCAYLI